MMGSVHNDLHSWAAKARGQDLDTIEIDLDTADRAAQKIVDLSNQVSELEHQARRREADLLEANNRYLRRAREAEQESAKLRAALIDLVSWFTSPVQGQNGMVWIIRAGEQGADDAVAEARSAADAGAT